MVTILGIISCRFVCSKCLYAEIEKTDEKCPSCQQKFDHENQNMKVSKAIEEFRIEVSKYQEADIADNNESNFSFGIERT